MRKAIVLAACCLFAFYSNAQTAIQNAYYSVVVAEGFTQSPAFIVTHKASKLQRRIVPQLKLVFTQEQPELTGAAMDGQPGVVAWRTKTMTTQDINLLGSTDHVAQSYVIKNNMLAFAYKDAAAAQVSLTVKFLPGQQAPVFEVGLEAHKKGEYALGFTGMPQVDSADVDFVYQPLTWSWKRFPGKFALTEEAYANTAAVFTNHHGYTEGLAVSLADIPYRYALAAQWNNAGKANNPFWSVFPADGPKANSLFGMAIRNPAGKAQPVIYSPLPGTGKARLNKGDKRSIGLVYVLYPGNWEKGTDFLLSSVFNYRSERQNAKASLNQTLDNMLDLAMNDVYGGWNKELKASNYQFDVPGTVKNVSALHPLSLYLFTGNEDILKRRAIPMIEYVMSREKFLFSTSDSAGQAQQPSHFLKGPCVDIGELVALDELTKRYTPAFSSEALRLFGKSRQLNMNTQTGGGSWQDYLARYRLTHHPDDLKRSMEGADEYLKQVFYKYSQTFFDSPGLRDRGAGFTTDYGLRIYDLFELFMETKKEVYLQAAITGAKQLLLWTRSNPAPPAGNITVNKGGEVKGIFPGRRVSALEGAAFLPMDETTKVAQAEIPAWQTSLNGLVPEAPNTYAFGPVMLAHHAAWLLRLAHYSNDTLLRNAAYNAVIGRYANFPGYYFTSLHTEVYQREDYARHPFYDIKYNAIFYNHIWPHLALLADFIVSDFYYRSKGRINFPGTFAPGYAFLTSQVYGSKKGTVMGNENVQVWMPSHALRSDKVAFNYLMGRNEKDLFISFANTAPKTVTQNIRFNKEVIPYQEGKTYRIIVYDHEGKTKEGSMKDGKLVVTLPANGIGCIQVKGIGWKQDDVMAGQVKLENRFVRYHANEDTLATATAMIIQPTEKTAVFYIYSNQTEKEWKQCTLRYRLNDSPDWTTVTDSAYPFEFDVMLPRTNDVISFEVTAVKTDGSTVKYPSKKMNH
ncbi:hypothetical protein GWC95_13635 [Sediminibacterium roseum]|uniref:Alpha-L-rhamnosidase six-hairpin glycosidase domain-containing protein n=1 Tax=Sediminibacterium roseum TaxID=1978412 RepID=A0ABW9ZWR3_9BACT|nr:hypothetical protein [Sediminibacterium roseum]NCI50970.1 hypothetical protein [Sediminibacterium roseum]